MERAHGIRQPSQGAGVSAGDSSECGKIIGVRLEICRVRIGVVGEAVLVRGHLFEEGLRIGVVAGIPVEEGIWIVRCGFGAGSVRSQKRWPAKAAS